jgi:chorismate dehydratase
MSKPLRLGSISFINSLPVDLGLITGSVPSEIEIVPGIPTELNQKALSGQVDVSAVSALWYAEHQDKFLLLPNLSISSESGVESVFLFSRLPMKHLKGKKIAVTRQGRTTPALLEILCRLRYDFRPDFRIVESGLQEIPENASALLLIGNDALTAKETMKKPGIRVVDLAEEWKEWTSLPFVFAVWVARREAFLADPKRITSIHEALLRSKQWGAEHASEILAEAECRTRLPGKVLENYFSKLSYHFDEGLKCGLKLYYEYAHRCGILKEVGELEEIGKSLEKRCEC